MLLCLLWTTATAQSSEQDTGQWGDVMELLHHIAVAENAEPMLTVEKQEGPPICYISAGQTTQLYVYSPDWRPLGVPVEGTIIDALHAHPDIDWMNPLGVLPCMMMEMEPYGE
jgi:hypothetical protein